MGGEVGSGIEVEERGVGVCERDCDEGTSSRRQGICFKKVPGRSMGVEQGGAEWGGYDFFLEIQYCLVIKI